MIRSLPRTLVATLLVAAVSVAVGCSGKADDEAPALEPTVEPPVIAEAGVLRVGVDQSLPPFAGEDKGRVAGLDVDVAAAVAEQLGLMLELTDVPLNEVADALATGDVDIALAALPISEAVLTEVSVAGSYVFNGPAIFSAIEVSETVTSLTGLNVGAQEASVAYWALAEIYGEQGIIAFETLREAFEAVDAGEIDVVVGDAIVGAYIARDMPSVRFVGQYGEAAPLGVAVAKSAGDLETVVREALDRLAADRVLEVIRVKWVGDVPALEAGISQD